MTSRTEKSKTDPAQRRQGLADRQPEELRARVHAAWTEFIRVASGADLDAPSRLAGLAARDVAVHLGCWPDQRALERIVASARTGGAHTTRRHDIDPAVLSAHRAAGRDAVLEALHAARDAGDEYFDSGLAAELGHAPAGSILGPLPVSTIVFAGCYELAVHALDLGPAGAPTPAPFLLYDGLGALADTTAALACRQGIDVLVSLQTPTGGWVTRSGAEGWETAERDAGPVAGAAVIGGASVLLDVSAGRQHVTPLLASGRLRAQGFPTLFRLVPIVEQVPGIPGVGPLRLAAASLGGAGRLLSRFPHRRP